MQKIFDNIMQSESTGVLTLMIIIVITLLFILDKVFSIKKQNTFLEQDVAWNKNFFEREQEARIKIQHDHHVLLKNLSQLPEFKEIPIERLEEFINKKVEYFRIKEEMNH